KLNTKIASLEAQLAESMQVHSKLAQRLHLPENVINSNNAPIYDKYINEELERRLEVIETHLAELLRKDTVDTNSTLNDHSNGGLEKRLGQIEAHLAKLARVPNLRVDEFIWLRQTNSLLLIFLTMTPPLRQSLRIMMMTLIILRLNQTLKNAIQIFT